jgi:hypothetical protein
MGGPGSGRRPGGGKGSTGGKRVLMKARGKALANQGFNERGKASKPGALSTVRNSNKSKIDAAGYKADRPIMKAVKTGMQMTNRHRSVKAKASAKTGRIY